jgi:phosphoglycerate dehydrogenase-like enzyme
MVMKVLLTADWMQRYFGDEVRAEFPQVEFVSGQTPEELIAAAGDVEVAFGAVSTELFRAAKALRWIQSASAGVEWMGSVDGLTESDVIVTNTRGAHAATMAEHAFGLLFFLTRGFDSLYVSQQQKVWQHPVARAGVGLAGLTMGIIGLGNIGRAIGERAKAFKMNVIAVDAHDVPQPEYVSKLGRLDEMPDLLRRADVVLVATPITQETRGMLGPNELKLMKPSAYLLVMSRGGIIDEPTLAQMLRDGKLAGAGLDVTAIEPLPADSELWDAPRTVITPHCSPSSSQTGANVTQIMQENLRHYVAGEPLTNLVNKQLGY